MGKGMKKVDLACFFALGIDVEDLTGLRPRQLRDLAWYVERFVSCRDAWAVKNLTERIVQIDADDDLRPRCRPLLAKLSKVVREGLAKTFDLEMSKIRTMQMNRRKEMEELKKILDKYHYPDLQAQVEDKTEKILRAGTFMRFEDLPLDQC